MKLLESWAVANALIVLLVTALVLASVGELPDTFVTVIELILGAIVLVLVVDTIRRRGNRAGDTDA